MDKQVSIIDSHCHFDAEVFDEDRDAVLRRATEVGVSTIISPATTAASWPRLKNIASRYPGVYPCYGLHPMFIDHHRDDHIGQLRDWVRREKPIAVGEIGLDFYLKHLDRERQCDIFKAQLDIAESAGLPVIIHARKSTEQVLHMLRQHPSVKGIVHSYSGSLEQASQLIKQNFKLGFGGPITWEGSKKLHRLIKGLPLESMVLETDAPDQTGQTHRGERNEPSYIMEVAEKIASIKNMPVESIIQQTRENTQRILTL